MSNPFIKAAVIGHPVKHSKSPLIHGYWIEKYGLAGSYGAVDLSPAELESGIRRLIEEEGYNGFNLTVPHKEAVLSLCDEVEDIARIIGAVNTLSVEGGRIIGFNTDAFGFWENILSAAPGFEAETAVVLGAGGATRAVMSVLMGLGVAEITIVNRTLDKAEKLAADMDTGVYEGRIKIAGWAEAGQALSGAQLLVNTTSLGMSGQPGLEIDLAALPRTALVNDIVYAPLMTPLLQAAQARGNPIVTGIGMLLHQARPAFKTWFGVMPEVSRELEEMVLR